MVSMVDYLRFPVLEGTHVYKDTLGLLRAKNHGVLNSYKRISGEII